MFHYLAIDCNLPLMKVIHVVCICNHWVENCMHVQNSQVAMICVHQTCASISFCLLYTHQISSLWRRIENFLIGKAIVSRYRIVPLPHITIILQVCSIRIYSLIRSYLLIFNHPPFILILYEMWMPWRKCTCFTIALSIQILLNRTTMVVFPWDTRCVGIRLLRQEW